MEEHRQCGNCDAFSCKAVDARGAPLAGKCHVDHPNTAFVIAGHVCDRWRLEHLFDDQGNRTQ